MGLYLHWETCVWFTATEVNAETGDTDATNGTGKTGAATPGTVASRPVCQIHSAHSPVDSTV